MARPSVRDACPKLAHRYLAMLPSEFAFAWPSNGLLASLSSGQACAGDRGEACSSCCRQAGKKKPGHSRLLVAAGVESMATTADFFPGSARLAESEKRLASACQSAISRVKATLRGTDTVKGSCDESHVSF